MKKFVEVWIQSNNQTEIMENKEFNKIEKLIQIIEADGSTFIQMFIYPNDNPKFLRGGYHPRIYLIFETTIKHFKSHYDIRENQNDYHLVN